MFLMQERPINAKHVLCKIQRVSHYKRNYKRVEIILRNSCTRKTTERKHFRLGGFLIEECFTLFIYLLEAAAEAVADAAFDATGAAEEDGV
jgi:hypothetical protein